LRGFSLADGNGTGYEGGNNMSMAEREQPFEPLTRRETIQRMAAAFAIILITFIAMVIIQSS
jgi:hypothetical protein